jgi:PAS domain S-box-containing protein
MQSLRTRFIVSGCLLLSAIVGCGAWSVIAMHRLGARLGDTLEQHQETIDIAVELIIGLEREDDALLLAMTGNVPRASEEVRIKRGEFEEAYARLKPRLDAANDREAYAALRTHVNAYRKFGDALVAAAGKPGAFDVYYKQVNPALREAVADCRYFRESNVDAMQQEGVEARNDASESSTIVAGITLATLLLSAVVLTRLTQNVMRPVRELDQAVDAIRRDKLDCRVNVRSADELGRLADGFNRMAEALEQYRREAEDRFRQLAENIHEIFWMSDARHEQTLYISPGYEDVWGRTCQSLYEQPRSWAESIHPDDRDAVIENLHQRKYGVFKDSEFRVVRPDDSIRWIRNRAFPINDPNGNLSRIAGLAEDITERKRSEEETRQAKERLELAVRGSNLSIWEFDMQDGLIDNSHVTFMNVWESLGYDSLESPTDLAAVYEFAMHPEDQGRVKLAVQACLSGETKEYEVEYRVRHKNGTQRWHLARGVALRDQAGPRVRFIGSTVDITDLKRAQDEREQLAVRFRLLLESTGQGIHGIDLNGCCTFINRASAEMLGYSPGEVLGRNMHELIHHSYADGSPYPKSQCPIFRVVREGSGCRLSEEVLWRKDGTFFAAEYSSFPIIHDGQRQGAVVTVTDITARKQVEHELRKAKELAEAANRAKDEFLANVSHEIRTPMNAILGMTELTLDTALTDEQRQFLKTVKSAADNLLGITNDLLDFSKIEAGKLELDLADFPLRLAISDTLQALAIRAHRKGLELVCNIQPDVPELLVGDAGRLRQVLLNLVGNAVKFTEEGEVIVRVETTDSAGGEGRVRLLFSVTDTGIGISADKHEAIFRAFEQEDTSTSRKYGGTGLGLTIASQLVKLMGGIISVDSQPNRGSVFTFTACFGLPPQLSESVAPKAPVMLRNLPVLIVDDNATNRYLLE